jgi:hypothetical protein
MLRNLGAFEQGNKSIYSRVQPAAPDVGSILGTLTDIPVDTILTDVTPKFNIVNLSLSFPSNQGDIRKRKCTILNQTRTLTSAGRLLFRLTASTLS